MYGSFATSSRLRARFVEPRPWALWGCLREVKETQRVRDAATPHVYGSSRTLHLALTHDYGIMRNQTAAREAI